MLREGARQAGCLLPRLPPPLHPTFVSRVVVIKTFEHNVFPNNFRRHLWENLIYLLNTPQADHHGYLKAGGSAKLPP